MWCSGLSTQHYHWSGLGCCYGVGSIPGPGTSTCHGCSWKTNCQEFPLIPSVMSIFIMNELLILLNACMTPLIWQYKFSIYIDPFTCGIGLTWSWCMTFLYILNSFCWYFLRVFFFFLCLYSWEILVCSFPFLWYLYLFGCWVMLFSEHEYAFSTSFSGRDFRDLVPFFFP